ncbi:MAG TPA: aldo/keto reductase [Acidimicrobiia bacterium]|nr:aldo/keto reductase [Acidimicrobiia bacterium]
MEVSLLGYGAMELRGAPRGRDLSEDEVGRILNRVLDTGITLIDTAIDYELSEERIGRHLAHRRNEYFLASKCGCLVGWQRPADYKGGMAGGGPHDFSPDNIRKGVEQSLVRLRTDHLDLVQLHGSPDRRTLEEDDVIEVLHELQGEGKTRFIGMSGVLPSLADHIRMDVFDVFQVPYSALQREHEQAISDAAAAGAGVLVRGGVARGAPSGDQRAVKRSPGLAETWDQARMAEVLDGMSPMEFTLRFTMSHPGVSSVLVGTANLDHLEANIGAASRGVLPADLYDEAKQRFALRTEEV